MDNRKNDPWGGNGYLSTILRAVKMQDATDYSEDETKTEFPPALDYATSAQRELLIREQSAALVCRHVVCFGQPCRPRSLAELLARQLWK